MEHELVIANWPVWEKRQLFCGYQLQVLYTPAVFEVVFSSCTHLLLIKCTNHMYTMYQVHTRCLQLSGLHYTNHHFGPLYIQEARGDTYIHSTANNSTVGYQSAVCILFQSAMVHIHFSEHTYMLDFTSVNRGHSIITKNCFVKVCLPILSLLSTYCDQIMMHGLFPAMENGVLHTAYTDDRIDSL